MQWLIHTLRAAWRRDPMLVSFSSLTTVVAIAAAVVFFRGDATTAITADPASPAFTETMLDELGADPDRFVDALDRWLR